MINLLDLTYHELEQFVTGKLNAPKFRRNRFSAGSMAESLKTAVSEMVCGTLMK